VSGRNARRIAATAAIVSLVVIAGAVAWAAIGRDETPDSTNETNPTAMAPRAVAMDDGTVVRLNGVEREVRASGSTSPPLDSTVTRIDVEACAGSEGHQAGPLRWQGVLAGGRVVEAMVDAGDLPTVGLGAGACIRGHVDLEVPPREEIVAIRFVDPAGMELARWTQLDGFGRVPPLEPPIGAEALPRGEPATFDAGETAVVNNVVEGTSGLSELDGSTQVVVEVEHCAGALPVSISPQSWFGVATGNWTSTALAAGDFPTNVLEPHECAAGTLVFAVPEGSDLTQVIVTGFVFTERARWSLE
jgi:hypothetical protein